MAKENYYFFKKDTLPSIYHSKRDNHFLRCVPPHLCHNLRKWFGSVSQLLLFGRRLLRFLHRHRYLASHPIAWLSKSWCGLSVLGFRWLFVYPRLISKSSKEKGELLRPNSSLQYQSSGLLFKSSLVFFLSSRLSSRAYASGVFCFLCSPLHLSGVNCWSTG